MREKKKKRKRKRKANVYTRLQNTQYLTMANTKHLCNTIYDCNLENKVTTGKKAKVSFRLRDFLQFEKQNVVLTASGWPNRATKYAQ